MGEKTSLGNRDIANALNAVIYRNSGNAEGKVSGIWCAGNLFTVLLTFAQLSV